MRLRTIALCLFLLVSGGIARADSIAAPTAYRLDVSDSLEFIMRSQGEWGTEEERLNDEYPASGVYRKGSKEPLWTVDWYAYEGQVFLTPDGKHVAHLGPWPNIGNWDELAVAFDHEGRPGMRYRVSNLVARPDRLQRSVSHYMWLGASEFDPAAGVLTLRTIPGQTYRFDLATGQILKDRQAAPAAIPWEGVALIVLAALGAGWFYRRRFAR